MEPEATVVVAEVIEDDDAADGGVGRPGCGCLTVGVGVVLVVAGIPMLVCPGPGIATIALGSGLVLTGLGLRSRGR
ncbi:MAG: hypothetical protein U1F44_02550 [Coriobacteriia bacterium]|nr:hypothetical protein [Coriobacteriia bacterium]